MITLSLTPQQFIYLKDAVARDLDNLEELEAWEIDDRVDEWKADVRMCKAMQRVLHGVEQTQVITH